MRRALTPNLGNPGPVSRASATHWKQNGQCDEYYSPPILPPPPPPHFANSPWLLMLSLANDFAATFRNKTVYGRLSRRVTPLKARFEEVGAAEANQALQLKCTTSRP
eukprot:6204354-Pleurochrysis_carterae.AAC.1